MHPPSLSSDVATGVTFGNYVVGALIGRGAMASVYRAEHVILEKAVALKLMDRSLLDSPGARERFLREGRVVASITHPNVVNITDVGVHEGVPYLVMELLVGEDLQAYLARHAPLDDRATTRLALPLVAALSAAHEAGVVHRDVKPSNIFLEQGAGGELVPKVLDFGISKFSLEHTGLDLTVTSPHQLLGSPLYLAPEALRGPGQLGPAADQYALGVVLYQCVTGRTPFRGDTLLALLGAVAQGTFEPPSALRPDLSPALERIIVRALALDPADRFPSLRDMGAALLGLAAQRTQVLWESSFVKPAGVQQAETPPLPLATRLPSEPLPLAQAPATLPPGLRGPRRRWIAGAVLLLLGSVLLLAQPWGSAAPGGQPAAHTAATPAAPALDTPALAVSPAAVSPAAMTRAPAIAVLPAPPRVEPSASSKPAEHAAAPELVTRVRALQTQRQASGSPVRERKPRRPRAAGAPRAMAAASARSAESDRSSLPAADAPRRGANQSPLLD